MKLISWNVNGLRACLGKGFSDYFAQQDADFFCLQETKMQPGQAQIPAPDYVEFFNSAEKKGYSGTAILAKQTPLSVKMGMDSDLHDHEGRLITLEYDKFYLVTVYTPNSQRGLTRLMYRMCWEEDFRLYLKKLDAQKPVIVCGDMNVAHQEIDLQPGLLVIVVQVPAHLGENVCDDVLKDGTLVTEKVSLQNIRLCALL